MNVRRTTLASLALCLASGAALAASTAYFSFLTFPGPNDAVRTFSTSTLDGYGITASGNLGGVTAVGGNPSAPVGGPCAILFAEVTFEFDPPRQRVGICAADADYGVDAPATLTLEAFDAADQSLGTVTRLLLPANTAAEQNRTAVFLGIETDEPIWTVRVRTSVTQTTILDNLVFEHVPGSQP